jgi:hypothetical protein
MKKFSDLVNEAVNLCDEEYDNAVWVAWFNNALDDLAEVLFIPTKTTISAVNGTFPVPTDLKSVIRIDSTTSNIKPLTIEDDTSIGYRVLDGNFEIQGETPSTIDITYYKLPKHLSLADSGADIDINNTFTGPIVQYACAQAMLREDEQERYEAYMTEYLRLKMTIKKQMNSQMPSRSGVVGVIR